MKFFAAALAIAMLWSPTTAVGAQVRVPEPIHHPAGGFMVKADDGFDLWFDAWGKGPAIIFLARVPHENREFADALSDAYRVVLYEPRDMTLHAKGALETLRDPRARALTENHLKGRNIAWNPAGLEAYPLDLMIADLHRVADAAGVDRFVLAGYSGSASLAAFLAPRSPRALGVILGGAHVLGWREYWLGYFAGYASAAAANPEMSDLTKALIELNVLQAEIELEQDMASSLGGLAGPKIIWGGAQDGEPDDPVLAKVFRGVRIGHRVREATADYERIGFQVFQLAGLGHMQAFGAAAQAVPLIRQGLVRAGYR